MARISGLAAGGHVLASLLLAGLIALLGLRFQQAINTQQGHIVGAVLVITGLAFLIWGLTGHGHGHDHDDKGHGGAHRHEGGEGHEHDHEHGVDHREPSPVPPATIPAEPHAHGVSHHAEADAGAAEHEHEHAHAAQIHSHPHSHEAYLLNRQAVLAERSQQRSLAARLAVIAVPFGVAASPDLTILPVGLAASAYGGGAVAAVLGVFAVVTMATFVGLTVVATAVGYQFRGEWLEKHATTITSLVLIAIGVVAYAGF